MLRVCWLLVVALALPACGNGKNKSDETSGEKTVGGETAPQPVETLPPKPLGVESPRTFNFKWGKGRKLYEAAREKGKGDSADWGAVIDGCKQALDKDANHLAAHFLLGIAYANTDKPSEAVEHLSTALAGDWLQWGPTLQEDGRLDKFFETDKGKALVALNSAYGVSLAKSAAAGLLVVAKRSGWKLPAKDGKQYAASRAELYSYSLETKRYLRLTHTGDAVVGYIESPSKDRIAYLWTTQFRINPGGDSPFVKPRVGVLDATTFQQIGKSARLKTDAVELMLFYGAGEELQLQTVDPNNLYSVDYDDGKLNESSGHQFADFETLYELGQVDREQPLLYATMDMARVLQPWGAVTKPASDLIVTRFEVKGANKMIRLPANGGKKIRRVTVSPNGSHVTFVGVGNGCAAEYESALYIAEARVGRPKHVHRGKGLHGVRWIDDNRFAFEADTGEIRLYDVAAGKTTDKIKNRAGIALTAVSNLIPFEHCPQPVKPPFEDESMIEDAEGIEDGDVEEAEFDDSEFGD